MDRPGKGVLLDVRGVTKRFGGLVANNDISFQVGAGELVGIIGPNGAGKSTLFDLLTGFQTADAGEVRLDGHPIARLRPDEISRLGVARTFQKLRPFTQMTVLENVMVGRHSRTRTGFLRNALRTPVVRREERDTAEKSRALIELLDLQAVAQLRVSDLPFGTQKRVELARALACEPSLLLLDEPASGLNHEEVTLLGSLIRTIRDRLRLTVLLVEHHMSLVMSISDRVVALNFGRKIAEGTPAEVRAHPDLIKAYLGAAG